MLVGIDGLLVLEFVMVVVFDEVLCCGVELIVVYVWSDVEVVEFLGLDFLVV